MLKDTVYNLLNDQINHELYSAYMYLSMASYFEAANLMGFAKWMEIQSGEEREHAEKFYEYIFDRGGKVVLKAIGEPPASWTGPLDAFENVYKHEQKVTSLINNIFAEAVKENDYATQVMLHWFINEQVEEEKNAAQVVEMLKMVGDNKNALMMVDHHLGERGE